MYPHRTEGKRLIRITNTFARRCAGGEAGFWDLRTLRDEGGVRAELSLLDMKGTHTTEEVAKPKQRPPASGSLMTSGPPASETGCCD